MAPTPGIVGVLGGMGPLATVDFLRKMLEATPVSSDQDHVPVIASNIPQVPDRAAAFRHEGDSPLQAMVCNGRRLVAAGAGLLVVPCNTAHLWFDALHDALGLPMLHLVDAAIDEVRLQVNEGGRVGLLATDATLASGLYPNRPLGRDHRLQWLLPADQAMREQVMPGIAAVKAGRLDVGAQLLSAAAHALRRQGAEAVVLGCTEIPVVLDAGSAGVAVVDATAALARRAVAWSLQQRGQAVPPCR